jgi:hypothetical protein
MAGGSSSVFKGEPEKSHGLGKTFMVNDLPLPPPDREE